MFELRRRVYLKTNPATTAGTTMWIRLGEVNKVSGKFVSFSAFLIYFAQRNLPGSITSVAGSVFMYTLPLSSNTLFIYFKSIYYTIFSLIIYPSPFKTCHGLKELISNLYVQLWRGAIRDLLRVKGGVQFYS